MCCEAGGVERVKEKRPNVKKRLWKPHHYRALLEVDINWMLKAML